jgi:prepilin-type N-terminal cleavage/methylation domain-containing protein
MLRIRKGGTKNRAFTLVELLVVVSIIALLIAILLPSLKRARESAKRVACNAGLRGVAQAGLTYAADDKDEFSIPIGYGDAKFDDSRYAYVGYGGKSGRGASLDLATALFGGANWMGAVHRPLNTVLFKDGVVGPKGSTGGGGSGRGSTGALDWSADAAQDLGLYHCAGDKGFTGMHQRGWKDSRLSAYDYFGTSFAANPLLIGVPGSQDPLKSNSMYRRPMSRVPSPSNTVLYWEYSARYAFYADNDITKGGEYIQTTVPGGGCYWPYTEYLNMTAHGHHGQDWNFNVSFGDGHAAWIKVKGHGYVDVDLANLGSYCKGTGGTSNRCKCVYVRGLGWQLDTLPSTPVVTNKANSGVSGQLASKEGSGPPFEVIP